MLHQEVEKRGENLGDLSKKKSFNFICSSIWQNFTSKLGFLLGIITVDSVYSQYSLKAMTTCLHWS